LGPGVCSDIETGARLFAAAAHPGVDEWLARGSAALALVGAALHELNRIQGTTDPFADSVLNAIVSLPSKWCNEQRGLVLRRLQKRAAAARAARPWIRDLLGEPQPMPKGMTKFNSRQISRYSHNSYHEDAEHFQERV
jgi:hypothetical protein